MLPKQFVELFWSRLGNARARIRGPFFSCPGALLASLISTAPGPADLRAADLIDYLCPLSGLDVAFGSLV